MRLYWIVLLFVLLAVGVFVVLPAFAPQVTSQEIIRSSEVTVGDTLCLVNQSELALPFYEYALQVNSTDPVVLKKKGEALIKCGKIGDANVVYTQILSQNKDDTDALVRQGDILVKSGDLNGGVQYYDAALAVNPRNAPVWLKKGDALLVMSMLETEKLKASAKTLALQPGSANYKASSNDQLVTMDSYKKAVESYQKAQELDPKLALIVSTRLLSATQNQIQSYQDILQSF
ncbi:tetratricopeptide repeat protein [Methanoregula sp.]|uniref:tetratricopeptide repeat protein n=1 Tax=Methanoregula sp. TaxID=2052170 RepID=UPI0035682A98